MFLSEIPIDFRTPEPENKFDEKLLADIEDIGCHYVYIFSEKQSPTYTFSIGHFHQHNHPELILFGIKPELSVPILNIAAQWIADGKERLTPFKRYSDFAEDYSTIFIPVDIEHYEAYLGYANWYYGSLPGPYPVLQMVWPDPANLFPWEEGYDKRYMKQQPLLGPILP